MNAIHFQGPVKESQQFRDFMNRDMGDQRQVYGLNEFFKEDVDQGFNSERQSQGVEFHFMVTAVHRGNVDGNMPFLINVLANLICF